MTINAVDFKKIESASLASIGYSAAATGDTLSVLARELVRRYPNGQLTEEAHAELKEGRVARKAELVGDRQYLVSGGEYSPIKAGDKLPKDAVTFTLTVGYAMALTAYEFGKLKSTDPGRYDIVGALRNKVQKYVSNRGRDLDSAIKAELEGTSGRTRRENKAYADWIRDPKNGAAVNLLTRARNGVKKGDPTAPKNKAELIAMITKAINDIK